jgi:hypothetical protein
MYNKGYTHNIRRPLKENVEDLDGFFEILNFKGLDVSYLVYMQTVISFYISNNKTY